MMKIGSEGFDKERQAYYPRPSGAGTERCIRAQVYHAMDIPETNGIGDRYALTISDSIWHEDLSRDLINRSAMFKLHSEQMALNCLELPFIKKPDELTEDDMLKIVDINIPRSREWHLWLHERGWKWCGICNELVPLNMVHGHIDGVLRDGVLDGKNEGTPTICPGCGQRISTRNPACPYCGHVIDDSIFNVD